jgi:uncharacterized protein (TIGR03435 family)
MGPFASSRFVTVANLIAGLGAVCVGQITTGVESLPSFEVASVKPTTHGRNAEGLSVSHHPRSPSPGSFSAINTSLEGLIRWAYSIQQYQMVGPDWLNNDSECFDVEARMPVNTTVPQMRLMVKALLRDRFGLAVHNESKMLPVYELHIAKHVQKLQTPEPTAKIGISYEGKFFGEIKARNTTMSDFASLLSSRLERPVIDKTGIQSHFAVNLQYRTDDSDTNHASVFTAIQETMGLQLIATKGPVETLVIDHIGRMPSDN